MSIDKKVKDYTINEDKFLQILDEKLTLYRSHYNTYLKNATEYKHIYDDFVNLKKNYIYDKQTFKIKFYYNYDKGELYYMLKEKKVIGFKYGGLR